jgi:D-3-phosphoglycerate dehydrogenase
MARIVHGPLTRALVTENPEPLLDDLLREGGFEVERLVTTPSEEELIERLRAGRHQMLFKRSRMPITRRVVESCPDLLAIQLCCIGDDSVDKEACAERGILVFNDPVSNGRSVVELVFAHLVGLSRRLYETVEETREGTWEKSTRERYEVHGKVLGVLGLGNIGRAVARAAECFGMKVLFYDNRTVAEEVGTEMGWAQVQSMDALFRGSDMVTVHVSATDVHGENNDGLITAEHFMALGADRPETSPRLFINLARGFVHTPEDLIAAVEAGRVRRAAVDVFPDEPRETETGGWTNPYRAHPRIATTPHMGAATQEAQPRIAVRVAHTAIGFSRVGSIRDCVYSPRTTIAMTEDAPGNTLLLVIHATTRGTKKALDDAIYEAEADNLRSAHRDFSAWGIAMNANLLDRPLSDEQLQRIVCNTTAITGDPGAVRLVRQIVIPRI